MYKRNPECPKPESSDSDVGSGSDSDEDSDEERSEIGLEPDDVEDLRPDDEGKKEAAEGEQFPMARTAHDPAEGRPCEEEYGDREDRPGRGNFSSRGGEENDGKDILHHEDADRDPSVCRPEVAVFIERFHGEDGAGKAEDISSIADEAKKGAMFGAAAGSVLGAGGWLFKRKIEDIKKINFFIKVIYHN